MGGVDLLDSLIALSLYDQNTFSKMVAQTFVSLHLYGYGTVLATILKYSPQMGVDHVPLQYFTMDLVLTLCI